MFGEDVVYVANGDGYRDGVAYSGNNGVGHDDDNDGDDVDVDCHDAIHGDDFVAGCVGADFTYDDSN